MSATINDVAKNLGLSVRAVRLRIDALDGVLDAHLRRGENNQLLFTGEALSILKHLEELRRSDGINVKQAASIVRKTESKRLESADPVDVEPAPSSHVNRAANPTSSLDLDVIRELLAEKDRTIARLEADKAQLQARVDQLIPLALPAPRRGILRLFKKKND